MEKKNVVFTKDGVRVGIKHVATEKYVDQTQSWVVKAWNLGGGKIEDKYASLPRPLASTVLTVLLRCRSTRKRW